ncbi:MAG: site-2 protease family protein [Haloferacaceae archaeon]
MRKFTIARIWGIPIRISVSLLVFLPVLTWLIGSGGQIELYAGYIEGLSGVGFDLAALRTGSTPWVIGFLAAIGLFVSVTLHELGHSWAALRYGLEIESITLWILGGIASLTSIPREWDREFWIAIAGPAVSVLVAAVCYGGLLVAPASLHVPRFVLGWLVVANLTLTAFNLLPAFPMDGGRVLRALLARSRPYESATRIAARVGVIFAVLFAVLGVLGFNVILILLALFIYGAATTESRTVMIDGLLEGITVDDIMTRDPSTVPADASIDDLLDRMLRERQTVFPVTDGGDVVGVVSLEDLQRAHKRDRTATIRSVVQDVPRVAPGDDAFDTLAALHGAKVTRALVEEDGRLRGVLSESDYAHALTVQRGFGASVAA